MGQDLSVTVPHGHGWRLTAAQATQEGPLLLPVWGSSIFSGARQVLLGATLPGVVHTRLVGVLHHLLLGVRLRPLVLVALSVLAGRGDEPHGLDAVHFHKRQVKLAEEKCQLYPLYMTKQKHQHLIG